MDRKGVRRSPRTRLVVGVALLAFEVSSHHADECSHRGMACPVVFSWLTSVNGWTPRPRTGFTSGRVEKHHGRGRHHLSYGQSDHDGDAKPPSDLGERNFVLALNFETAVAPLESVVHIQRSTQGPNGRWMRPGRGRWRLRRGYLGQGRQVCTNRSGSLAGLRTDEEYARRA